VIERASPKLGTVLQDLQENSRGEWDRNIAEKKVDDFLKMDIYSTPSLQKDELNATQLMRIRLDSRGGAIKRTILGYRD